MHPWRRRVAFAFSSTCLGATALVAYAGCSVFSPQTGARIDRVCVDEDSDPTRAVSFAKQIRPLMDKLKDDPSGPGCKSCHYRDGADVYAVKPGIDEGGLDLSTLRTMRAGGKTSSQKVIVPKKPCSSAMIQKLVGIYPIGDRMPRGAVRYWTPEEIQLVFDWIAEGAEGGNDE